MSTTADDATQVISNQSKLDDIALDEEEPTTTAVAEDRKDDNNNEGEESDHDESDSDSDSDSGSDSEEESDSDESNDEEDEECVNNDEDVAATAAADEHWNHVEPPLAVKSANNSASIDENLKQEVVVSVTRMISETSSLSASASSSAAHEESIPFAAEPPTAAEAPLAAEVPAASTAISETMAAPSAAPSAAYAEESTSTPTADAVEAAEGAAESIPAAETQTVENVAAGTIEAAADDVSDPVVDAVMKATAHAPLPISPPPPSRATPTPPPPPPSSTSSSTPIVVPSIKPATLLQASAKPKKKPVITIPQLKLEICTPHARSTNHTKLRRYETTRRSNYQSKLQSSSLYWRSFRSLLSTSLTETQRAELVVKCFVNSDRMYSENMKAAHYGLLDGDGHAITDSKKLRKALEERGLKQDAAGTITKIDPNSKGISSGPSKNFRLQTNSSTTTTSSTFDPSTSERRGGMLNALIDSTSILHERLGKHVQYVSNEIVPELTSLREQLEVEVMKMESLGDAILEELEKGERVTVENWETYYAVASQSLAGGQSSTPKSTQLRRGAAAHGTPQAANFSVLPNLSDVWLAEMRYRMSVSYQSSLWDKSSTELSRLFASMKETECSRRFRLRELLIVFLKQQERTWLGLPSVVSPVLKDLVNRPMDRVSIEDDVQTSIRLRAQGIQKDEQEKKKSKPSENETNKKSGLITTTTSDANKTDTTPSNDGKSKFELSSPLTSDLIYKAKIIEKKSSNMMSMWKRTLAIVTADSFLHLFEIPSTIKVQSGSAPEAAFHALMPQLKIPTEESVELQQQQAKTMAAAVAMPLNYALPGSATKPDDHLMPTESIALPNACIYYKDGVGNSAFEITETFVAKGATKVFSKTTTRKMYLRTLNKEHTKDLISILQANK